LVGNPKGEIAYPEAHKKTLMSLLQSALVVQHVESEANDPIPEEEGIFVLVSLTTRPRSRGGEALESLHGRALVFPGVPALFENR
jgi:hypothetical protein